MKCCLTCGCHIADAASVCESCEAWAAALIEARPAAPPPAGAEPATASRRHLTWTVAAVAAIALTGLAMSARGGSPPDVSGGAAPPAAHIIPSAASATAETAVQTWSTENQGSWLDSRHGAAFDLLSENIVKTSFGPARPTLVIRCTSRRIDAFVITGSPMKIDPRVEGKSVTISMDGEPARTEHWIDSDDRTAVFASDPAAFTQRLRTARTLRFGYSPHNSSDVVAQFHVPGIDGLITAAARHCGASFRR